MRIFLLYTGLRLAIVAGCFGVLYLIFGAYVHVLPLLFAAVLFGAGVSFLLLRRWGADAGKAMVGGVHTIRHRLREAAAREDVDDDADYVDYADDGSDPGSDPASDAGSDPGRDPDGSDPDGRAGGDHEAVGDDAGERRPDARQERYAEPSASVGEPTAKANANERHVDRDGVTS